MTTFNETREFKALRDTWYAKLKAEGFEDVENDYEDVKRTVYRDREALRRGGLDEAALYYQRCGRWLHLNVWRSRARKRTFELHAEGVPLREIVTRLGTAAGHQLWFAGSRVREERRAMEAFYRDGGDPDEEFPKSLLEQHLAAEGDFKHILTRGEPING